MKKALILASASPRRQELLRTAGIPFVTDVSGADESVSETDPAALTEMLAKRKCLASAKRQADAYVLGADTVVYADGMILGKPKDAADAFSMLKRISGSTHEVYTGVALADVEKAGVVRILSKSVHTTVHIHAMSDTEIRAYIETREPFGKAGSYAIQGLFSRFIDRIEGDYTNVVGLPVSTVYQMLGSMEQRK